MGFSGFGQGFPKVLFIATFFAWGGHHARRFLILEFLPCVLVLGSVWVLWMVLRALCLGVLSEVLVWFSGVLLGFSGFGPGFPRVLFIAIFFLLGKGSTLADF